MNHIYFFRVRPFKNKENISEVVEILAMSNHYTPTPVVLSDEIMVSLLRETFLVSAAIIKHSHKYALGKLQLVTGHSPLWFTTVT